MDGSARHAATTRASVTGRPSAVAVAVAVVLSALAAVVVAPTIAFAATTPTTATVISTAKNDKLGTILVSGNTVYTVKTKAACTAQCAKTWTAVVLPSGVTDATAGSGVDTSKLGTKETSDGSLQVTYGGKPLYWSTKDKAPGQVHGAVSDKWGKWAAVVTAAAKSGTAAGAPTPVPAARRSDVLVDGQRSDEIRDRHALTLARLPAGVHDRRHRGRADRDRVGQRLG